MNEQVIQWIQSIDGVFTLSFMGLSITSIAGMIFNMIKTRRSLKILGSVTGALKKANEYVDKLTQSNKEKEERIAILEAENKIESRNNAAINEVTLETLLLIIAQSSGIHASDKLQIFNKINSIQSNVIEKNEKIKEDILSSVEKAKEFLEGKNEKAEEVVVNVKETFKKGKSLLEKYKEQA